MKRNALIPLLLMAAVLAGGCSKRPKGVASDSRMVEIVADMEMAEGYLETQGDYSSRNSLREGLMQGILDKHGMTKAEFDSTMTWYGRNPDVYAKLYAKVDKELANRQKKLTGGIAETTYSDLWPYNRHVMVSPNAASDNLAFSIEPDELGKGARLVWKMRLNSMPGGRLMLGVVYADGETRYLSNSLGTTRSVEVSLQTDTARKVRSIFGSFVPESLSGRPLLIDSISLQEMPFDSVEYYRAGMLRHYSPGRLIKVEKTETDSIAESGMIVTPAQPISAAGVSGSATPAPGKVSSMKRSGKLRRASDDKEGTGTKIVNMRR